MFIERTRILLPRLLLLVLVVMLTLSVSCVTQVPTYTDVTPPEFTIGQATWDAEMPFEQDSQRGYDFPIKNLATETHRYSAEVYFNGVLSMAKQSNIAAGGVMECISNQYMPYEPGVYQMTTKLGIDDVYIDEFVVSKVEVVAI